MKYTVLVWLPKQRRQAVDLHLVSVSSQLISPQCSDCPLLGLRPVTGSTRNQELAEVRAVQA